jgi:hypothetical protein
MPNAYTIYMQAFEISGPVVCDTNLPSVDHQRTNFALNEYEIQINY